MNVVAVVGGSALVVLMVFFWLSSKGRFFISHPNGYISFGPPEKGPREATRDQLSAALFRLVQADRYDLLWIYIDPAQEGRSFGVHIEEGQPYIEAAFKLAGNESAEFKAIAKEIGLELLEDADFNEGMGDGIEEEWLTYRAPAHPKELSEVVFQIIGRFFPDNNSEFIYLSASCLNRGPLSGTGLVWRRQTDLLDDVI